MSWLETSAGILLGFFHPHLLIWYLHFLFWGLSVLKLRGIWNYILWVRKHAEKYRKEVLREVDQRKESRQLEVETLRRIEENCKIPRQLFAKLVHWLEHHRRHLGRLAQVLIPAFWFIGKVVYRAPVLLLVLALMLFVSPFPDRWMVSIDMGLIFLLMYSELINLLMARSFLGFVDNFRPDFEFDPITFPGGSQLEWSKTRFIRKFLFGIGSFLGASIIGFGALYYGIYIGWGADSFSDLPLSDVSPQFQFIYFSIVTLATVGYGDILPNSRMSQAAAALEVLFGMGVLVFLLFALSNTFSSEDG